MWILWHFRRVTRNVAAVLAVYLLYTARTARHNVSDISSVHSDSHKILHTVDTFVATDICNWKNIHNVKKLL